MVWPLIAAGAQIIGGAIQARSTRSTNTQNAALQREFAQYGIRWKVDDARAAGLHPLYAGGMSTNAAQPSYESSPMGAHVAQAGTEYARNTNYQRERRSRNLNAAKNRQIMRDQHLLEQQKARSQIHVDTAQANYYNALAAAAKADANNNNDGATSIESADPAVIAEAQDTGKVRVKPKELTTNQPGSPSIEAGQNPLWVKEKAGGPFTQVRLNDESAEAWGDVAAPLINAAATAYFYMFDTVPSITRKNWRWLVRWYFKNRDQINRRMNREKGSTQDRLQYGP